MKVCKFCNTVVDNECTKCPSCTASEFKNKCDNCGTVYEANFCPTCGVKAGTSAKVCPSCGNTYYTPACPTCGGVNRSNNGSVIEHRVIIEKEPEKKKVTFGRVLLWIFFLPIMATIAIWKKTSKLPLWAKILLTVLVWGWIVIGTITNDKDKKESKATVDKSALVSSETIEESTLSPEEVVVEETPKTEEASETKSDTRASNEIDPEFQKAMDDYVAFFNEYATFMKKFSSSSNSMSMLGDYTKMMTKYSEAMDGLNKIDSDSLTEAEYKLYMKTLTKANNILLDAVQ